MRGERETSRCGRATDKLSFDRRNNSPVDLLDYRRLHLFYPVANSKGSTIGFVKGFTGNRVIRHNDENFPVSNPRCSTWAAKPLIYTNALPLSVLRPSSGRSRWTVALARIEASQLSPILSLQNFPSNDRYTSRRKHIGAPETAFLQRPT